MKICIQCKEPKYNFQMKHSESEQLSTILKVCKKCFKERIDKIEDDMLSNDYSFFKIVE